MLDLFIALPAAIVAGSEISRLGSQHSLWSTRLNARHARVLPFYRLKVITVLLGSRAPLGQIVLLLELF